MVVRQHSYSTSFAGQRAAGFARLADSTLLRHPMSSSWCIRLVYGFLSFSMLLNKSKPKPTIGDLTDHWQQDAYMVAPDILQMKGNSIVFKRFAWFRERWLLLSTPDFR